MLTVGPRMNTLRDLQLVPLTEAGTQTHNKSNPEWARIPEVIRLFGIKRTRLFELIAEGKIKSVNLRKRGNSRGVRIISCDSVRALLSSAANGGGK